MRSAPFSPRFWMSSRVQLPPCCNLHSRCGESVDKHAFCSKAQGVTSCSFHTAAHGTSSHRHESEERHFSRSFSKRLPRTPDWPAGVAREQCDADPNWLDPLSINWAYRAITTSILHVLYIWPRLYFNMVHPPFPPPIVLAVKVSELQSWVYQRNLRGGGGAIADWLPRLQLW